MRPGSGLLADTALNRDCMIRSFVIFEIFLSILSLIFVFLAYSLSCIKTLLLQNSLTSRRGGIPYASQHEKSLFGMSSQKHS
jgi:hypothetical protein